MRPGGGFPRLQRVEIVAQVGLTRLRHSRTMGQAAMIQRETEIRNELGLHLRAAGTFVRLASRFKSQIKVATPGRVGSVDGKSILGLATLGTPLGAKLVISAEGPDEVEALSALVELVESRFGE